MLFLVFGLIGILVGSWELTTGTISLGGNNEIDVSAGEVRWIGAGVLFVGVTLVLVYLALIGRLCYTNARGVSLCHQGWARFLFLRPYRYGEVVQVISGKYMRRLPDKGAARRNVRSTSAH